MKKTDLKVIFIPGNGGCTMQDFWFPYGKRELEALGLPVTARNFPDPELARKQFWIPFLHDELKSDAHSILIGVSSGAVAAMRYAESYKIFGSVLIGAEYTDLGVETEKASGYYDRPWDWEKIKANQNWIIQFASTDDPFTPISEARHIHECLNTEYHEFTDRGHFQTAEFPELVEVMQRKLNEPFSNS